LIAFAGTFTLAPLLACATQHVEDLNMSQFSQAYVESVGSAPPITYRIYSLKDAIFTQTFVTGERPVSVQLAINA
jgi:hypothetical protein